MSSTVADLHPRGTSSTASPAGCPKCESLGTAGTILGAVVAGLADVDAMTVSLTRLTPTPLTSEHVAIGVLTAVASDTVSGIGVGAPIAVGDLPCRLQLCLLVDTATFLFALLRPAS